MRVERRHEEPIAEYTESPVHQTAARRQVARGRQLTFVSPDLAAGPGVNGPRDVQRSGDVQDVVAQQRRRFESPCGVGLKHPLRRETVDVLGRNLTQRTVALVGGVPAEHERARTVSGEAVEKI